jgi:hypothetical protein
VYRRAARLRRRHVVTAVFGSVAVATAVAALLAGSFFALVPSSGQRLAIGNSTTTSSLLTSPPIATSPSRTTSTPTTTIPGGAQGPTTTMADPAATAAPPTSLPTVTSLPTTTVSPPTTTSPARAIMPGGCGQPSVPATPTTPAELGRELVGTWVQCAGPSIFGTEGGGALEIFANGTWQQLASTPGGWVPLEGKDDAGTWQVLEAPSVAHEEATSLVRFVATASPTAAPTTPVTTTATPHEWTADVTVTLVQPVRAQFVEGTIVANYSRIMPSSSGATPNT